MPVPDFSPGEVLTAAAMDSIGLWLIEKKDVVAAGIIDFTSVFSSDYSGYRLIFDYTNVTNPGDLRFQFRDSSGAIATTTYLHNWAGQGTSSGTPFFSAYSYQTVAITFNFICSNIVGGRVQGSMDIINPQNSAPCSFFGSWNSVQPFATITQANIVGNGTHNASVTRTGFRLFTSAGTATGKFALYGYRN
jgi:hypothetical protein